MIYIEQPNYKICLEFAIKRNFSVSETVQALSGLERLFKKQAIQYLKRDNPKRKIKPEEVELYITTLKSGSLVLEVVQAAHMMMGLVQPVYECGLYTNYIEALKFLLERLEQVGNKNALPTIEISKADAQCASDIASIFMNQAAPGSLNAAAFSREVNMGADGSYQSLTKFVIGADRMVDVFNGAEITKAFLSHSNQRKFTNKLMTVHQINESINGEKGDEVKIESLCSFPLKTTFASVEGEYIKSHLVNDPANPFIQKFEASGVVLLDKDGRPSAYHISAVKKIPS